MKRIGLFISVFFLGLMFWLHGPVGLFRVTSGSMEPAIKVGEICVVNRSFEFYALKEGDVIVFSYGNLMACHRIVSIDGKAYVTKGDANSNPDVFLVTKENYYGKVVAVI